jgi:hypothetical protein
VLGPAGAAALPDAQHRDALFLMRGADGAILPRPMGALFTAAA